MSKHSSFADDMPDLYPEGTARERDIVIDNRFAEIEAAIKKANPQRKRLTARQKHDILRVVGFRNVEMQNGKCIVTILSPVAPELDCWIMLQDDPVPEERTLDSDWES